MAFYRIKGQDREALPAGAVEVRTSQVAGFYKVVVETWERPSEVWALRYGPTILGAAGAFNGWYGNAYFRKKLRLKNFGFFSTYLPNMLLPFLIVQALNDSVISCHSQFVLATCSSNFFIKSHFILAVCATRHFYKSIRLQFVQRNEGGFYPAGYRINSTITDCTSVNIYVCNQTFHPPDSISDS